MSPEEDPISLPTLKIPCRIVRNPTYFTKYLPDQENNQRRAGPTPVERTTPQLPCIFGKGVKKPGEEKKPPVFRYDTAYGNAFVVKQLVDKQIHLDDVANVLEQRFPKPFKNEFFNDFYSYKPKVKRNYELWESRKDVKYFQGDIDKKLVEAKQRINKTWRREMKQFFKKEKKTEDVVLRRAENMDRGLKAYLRKVEKEVQKYEKDEKLAKLRKKMFKSTKVRENDRQLQKPRKSQESLHSVDAQEFELPMQNSYND